MTDADIAQAVESLTARIKARDLAIRDGEDVPDADWFARDFLAAMAGRGWRPTEARVMPSWKSGPRGDGGKPPVDLLEGLRAELAAKADRAAAERKGDAA